jgi:hypothetical protein
MICHKAEARHRGHRNPMVLSPLWTIAWSQSPARHRGHKTRGTRRCRRAGMAHQRVRDRRPWRHTGGTNGAAMYRPAPRGSQLAVQETRTDLQGHVWTDPRIPGSAALLMRCGVTPFRVSTQGSASSGRARLAKVLVSPCSSWRGVAEKRAARSLAFRTSSEAGLRWTRTGCRRLQVTERDGRRVCGVINGGRK